MGFCGGCQFKPLSVHGVPYDGKSIGSDEGASESYGRLVALGVFFGDELGMFIGDELPTNTVISPCISQVSDCTTFEKRGPRGGLWCRHPQRAPSRDSRGTGHSTLSRCPPGCGRRPRVKQRLSRRSIWHRLFSRFVLLHVII